MYRSSYVFGPEVVINNSTTDCTVSELRTPGFINPTNSCLYSVSFIWRESFYSRRRSQNQTYEYSKKGTVLGFSLPWRPQCFSQACTRKIYTLFLKKSIVYWCGLNILIFLPSLHWKHSCEYSWIEHTAGVFLVAFRLVLPLRKK